MEVSVMGDRNVTAERLRELFNYDPKTGILTRRFTRGSRIAGSVVGNVAKDGRVQLSVDNNHCRAHRIIWLMVTGSLPLHDVDHVDGNPSNNRWDNLRDVPHKINLQNRQGATKANPLKLLGVQPNHNRFMANIKIDGKRVYLGTYKTPQEAHAVYLEAKRKYHEGNTL
jgi:hypothetical protein